MKRIYHESELDEGDFVLFLYGKSVVDLKLKFDYGLITAVDSRYGEVFVKWFFDPCGANEEDDPPEVIEGMPQFNGKFYLIKKNVPIHF